MAGLLGQGAVRAEARVTDAAKPSVVGTVSTQMLQGEWQIAIDPKNVGREERWFDSAAVDGAALQSSPKFPVTVWDNAPELSNWFVGRGCAVTGFEPTEPATRREVIFIGGESGSQSLGDPAAYRALMARVAQGTTAIFLATEALGTPKAPQVYLPLAKRGKLEEDSAGYFWGRDDIVMPHPTFEALPSRCVMDLHFYRDIIPYRSFLELDETAEVIVPCFALGRPGGQGYWSAANLVIYRFGAGKIIISTLRLLENLGRHPAADQIVINLLAYAYSDAGKPLSLLPTDFPAQLEAVGYPGG